jgi:hypothetical protein
LQNEEGVQTAILNALASPLPGASRHPSPAKGGGA